MNDWQKFISKKSSVDLTNIISFPISTIKKEVETQLNQQRNLFYETRSYSEIQNLKEKVAVIKKPEENGEYVKSDKWRACSLYNYSGQSKDVIISGFNNVSNGHEYRKVIKEIKKHQWTDKIKLFPNIKKYAENVLQQYFYLGYIRLMILFPGGIIPPHTDHSSGSSINQSSFSVFNALNSINIAILEPDGHKFFLGGKLLPFNEGSIFWINTGIEHWLVNMSLKPRVHLLIQGIYKKKFRDLIFKNIENKKIES